MKTIILLLTLLFTTSSFSSVIALKGTDQDGIDCELEIKESEFIQDSYTVIINNEDRYTIPKTDFSNLSNDEITRIKAKNSSINGTRELIIEFKPNYETVYTIIQKDKVHFETTTYKCSQLKSIEK
jgi:hypothetical protein